MSFKNGQIYCFCEQQNIKNGNIYDDFYVLKVSIFDYIEGGNSYVVYGEIIDTENYDIDVKKIQSDIESYY